MYLGKTDKEIISSLKGRISKVLSIATQLEVDIRTSLEDLYSVLDEIILWDKKMTKRKINSFKKQMKHASSAFQETNKKYVKEHIMPLVDKMIEREWVVSEDE